jgi:hypothetical protein
MALVFSREQTAEAIAGKQGEEMRFWILWGIDDHQKSPIETMGMLLFG